MISHIITANSIVVFVGNETHTLANDHPNYLKMAQAIRDNDEEAVRNLVNLTSTINKVLEGTHVSIVNGSVMYQGETVNPVMAEYILRMVREGFDATPAALFLQNLIGVAEHSIQIGVDPGSLTPTTLTIPAVAGNPSKRAVDELFGMLEGCRLPLTPDGHFLAYKKVRKPNENGDMFDIFKGTTRNNVGDKPSMPRNKVDEDKNRTCSTGLHFCSLEYLKNFGEHDDPIVILKINPRDVVAIPTDYNNTKGRCCLYEVIGIHKGTHEQAAFKTVVHSGATVRVARTFDELMPEATAYANKHGLIDGKDAAREAIETLMSGGTSADKDATRPEKADEAYEDFKTDNDFETVAEDSEDSEQDLSETFYTVYTDAFDAGWKEYFDSIKVSSK